MGHNPWEISTVDLLYETWCIIPHVGNLTEQISCVNMFEFPTGVWIMEACWKWNLAFF
jgi:hypothetical protein